MQTVELNNDAIVLGESGRGHLMLFVKDKSGEQYNLSLFVRSCFILLGDQHPNEDELIKKLMKRGRIVSGDVNGCAGWLVYSGF